MRSPVTGFSMTVPVRIMVSLLFAWPPRVGGAVRAPSTGALNIHLALAWRAVRQGREKHGIPDPGAGRGPRGRRPDRPGAPEAARAAGGAAAAFGRGSPAGRPRRRALGRGAAGLGGPVAPGLRLRAPQGARRRPDRDTRHELPGRRSSPASSTSSASRRWSGAPGRTLAPAAPTRPRACCARRSGSGTGRRSPTSPTSRSPRPSAERLEERRLHALELLGDAELALGRHDARAAASSRRSSPSIRSASASARQQVLALYRAGRQQEALEAYRAAASRSRRARDRAVGPSCASSSAPSSARTPSLGRTGAADALETRLPGAADPARRPAARARRRVARCFATRRGWSRSPARAGPARPAWRWRSPRSSSAELRDGAASSTCLRCAIPELLAADRSRRRSASRTASGRPRRRSPSGCASAGSCSCSTTSSSCSPAHAFVAELLAAAPAPERARDEPRAAAALRRARVPGRRRSPPCASDGASSSPPAPARSIRDSS